MRKSLIRPIVNIVYNNIKAIETQQSNGQKTSPDVNGLLSSITNNNYTGSNKAIQ